MPAVTMVSNTSSTEEGFLKPQFLIYGVSVDFINKIKVLVYRIEKSASHKI